MVGCRAGSDLVSWYRVVCDSTGCSDCRQIVDPCPWKQKDTIFIIILLMQA